MTQTAGAIVAADTRREESRGAHFRADFPAPDATLEGCHLIHTGDEWRYGKLADARRSTLYPKVNSIEASESRT
jgi:succinate dehydrogenase/fumarate reductase flavoprotein subunit